MLMGIGVVHQKFRLNVIQIVKHSRIFQAGIFTKQFLQKQNMHVLSSVPVQTSHATHVLTSQNVIGALIVINVFSHPKNAIPGQFNRDFVAQDILHVLSAHQMNVVGVTTQNDALQLMIKIVELSSGILIFVTFIHGKIDVTSLP